MPAKKKIPTKPLTKSVIVPTDDEPPLEWIRKQNTKKVPNIRTKRLKWFNGALYKYKKSHWP